MVRHPWETTGQVGWLERHEHHIYSQLVNEQQYQENGLEASSATTQGTEQEDAGCCAGYQLKGLAHSVIYMLMQCSNE